MSVQEKPMVLAHQKIQFETAQSWNPGNGNQNHNGVGNNGNGGNSGNNGNAGNAGNSGNNPGNSGNSGNNGRGNS